MAAFLFEHPLSAALLKYSGGELTFEAEVDLPKTHPIFRALYQTLRNR